MGHYCLSQEKVDNTIKCAMILMRKLSNTKVELYAQKISGVDRWIGVKEKLYTRGLLDKLSMFGTLDVLIPLLSRLCRDGSFRFLLCLL